jgi:glycosyltransferase involved in cell wall biosynthesis
MTPRQLGPKSGDIPEREADLAIDAARSDLIELRRELAAIGSSRAWRLGHGVAMLGRRALGRHVLTDGAPHAAIARIDRLLGAVPVLRGARPVTAADTAPRSGRAQVTTTAAVLSGGPAVASLVPWPGEWEVAHQAAANAGCAVEVLLPAGAAPGRWSHCLPVPSPARRWHHAALGAATCERVVLLAPGACVPDKRWLAELSARSPLLLPAVALVATRAQIELAGGLDPWREPEAAFADLAGRLGTAEQDHVEAVTFAIVAGTRDATARGGGDLPFADGMARALTAAGCPAVSVSLDGSTRSAARSAPIVVHVRGRQRRMLRGDQRNVLWIISHPDDVGDEECAAYDLVCTASATLADALRRRTACSVLVLEQATDAARFRPAGPRTRDVVFVGNAVGRRRPVVEAIAATDVDLHIWGRGWTGAAARRVRGEHLPDGDLPGVYASARIVLNDTWPDMRAAGILPNRIFDALACGACVVSDDVAGAQGRFGGALRTSDDPLALRAHVLDLLDDPGAALELGLAAGEEARREHGFDARSRTLMAALG